MVRDPTRAPPRMRSVVHRPPSVTEAPHAEDRAPRAESLRLGPRLLSGRGCNLHAGVREVVGAARHVPQLGLATWG